MRASLFCSATLFSMATFAFPSMLKKDISEEQLAEITALAEKITQQTSANVQLRTRAGFDSEAQSISVTGDHAYKAPGSNDIRGPCPGLNAMANHGYISRNGVVSVVDLTTASNKVYGMGLDLAAFLSVYAGVMAGDITSVSIGGKPASGLLGGLTSGLGLLGEAQGISNSHNRFEADASPLRADLYKTNDADSLSLPQFEQLAAMPLGPNGYDLTVMHPFRGARFNDSVATNGRFFAGPFTHFAVNTATYLFTYNFFANFSAEHLDGYLDLESLKAFEGVTGEKGSFKWTSGAERIPENWHRRPIGNDYGFVQFIAEALGALQALPYLVVVGGNTGEPNTFTGVNAGDLTGGLFNTETLLEGNNALCFAFQAANAGAPDVLRGLLGNALQAISKLTDALSPLLSTLGCPQLAKYDPALVKQFPGAGAGL